MFRQNFRPYTQNPFNTTSTTVSVYSKITEHLSFRNYLDPNEFAIHCELFSIYLLWNTFCHVHSICIFFDIPFTCMCFPFLMSFAEVVLNNFVFCYSINGFPCFLLFKNFSHWRLAFSKFYTLNIHFNSESFSTCFFILYADRIYLLQFYVFFW